MVLFQWGLFLSLLLLLILSVWRNNKVEEEKYFWVKLIFLFGLSLVTLTIGTMTIPLAIGIAYLFLFFKPRQNVRMKRLALHFGLVYFILAQFVPAVSFGDLAQLREKSQLVNRFETVYALHDYSRKSPIQKKITNYVDKRENLYDTKLMMKTWMLQHLGVEIKSARWLETEAAESVGFKWQASRNEAFTRSYVLFKFENGKHYLGVFKREKKEAPYYLDYVIVAEGYKTFQSGIFRHF